MCVNLWLEHNEMWEGVARIRYEDLGSKMANENACQTMKEGRFEVTPVIDALLW